MPSPPSSVLLTVRVPPHGEARSDGAGPPGCAFEAHLLDPFIPLLRAHGGCAITCPQPPFRPYLADPGAPGPSDRPQGKKRRKRRRSGDVAPVEGGGLAALGAVRFSGKASRRQLPQGGARASDPPPRGEAEHHASVKADLEGALAAVRCAWLLGGGRATGQWYLGANGESTGGGSLSLQEKVDATDRESVDWGSLTRDMLQKKGTETASASSGGTPLDEIVREGCEAGPCGGSGSQTIITAGTKLYVPLRGHFAFATMEHFKNSISRHKKHFRNRHFDVIVIDPPWENASAARSSSYHSVELYELYKMDLKGILRENSEGADGGPRSALVAVWVTNRPKFRRFLKDKFLPESGLQGPYAEWYWMKVTASTDQAGSGGQPVFPLDSDSPRRCYEGLVLGWYTPEAQATGCGAPPTPRLPLRKVFVSVPLGHSRKPDILDLLRPYLATPDPNVLELFARGVGQAPLASSGGGVGGHWLSVGDEVLRFCGAPWVRGGTPADASISCLPDA